MKYRNDGKFIAKNLLKAGYKLKVYEINPEIKKGIWLLGEEREYTKIE